MTILPKKKSTRGQSSSSSATAGASSSSDHDLAAGVPRRVRDHDDHAPAVMVGARGVGSLSHQRKRKHNHSSRNSLMASSAVAADVSHQPGPSHGYRRRSDRTKSWSDSGAASQDSGEACNSDDEHRGSMQEYSLEREMAFEERLKKSKGFMIKRMHEDGACLFRACADQLYGDQDMHGVLRKLCIDYMAKNSDYYSQYVTEDFKDYLFRKRSEHCHGNHLEMQAIAELFNRTIEVYEYNVEPMNTFHGAHQTDNAPIRVSYHGGVHYNSVVDPYAATIGVGLGLPEFYPGLAEQNLMNNALAVSENDALEQTMLQDKIKATELEATERALAAAAARESYQIWLKDQTERVRQKKSSKSEKGISSPRTTALQHSHTTKEPRMNSPKTSAGGAVKSPSSSAPVTRCQSAASSKPPSPSGAAIDCPQLASFRLSASDLGLPACGSSTYGSLSPRPGPSHAPPDYETASIIKNLPPGLFGLDDWADERDILTQVLALSQQEYLESLKKHASSPSSLGDEPNPTLSSADGTTQGVPTESESRPNPIIESLHGLEATQKE